MKVNAALAENAIKNKLIDISRFSKDTKLIFNDFVTTDYCDDLQGNEYLSATFTYLPVKIDKNTTLDEALVQEEENLEELEEFLKEENLELGLIKECSMYSDLCFCDARLYLKK